MRLFVALAAASLATVACSWAAETMASANVPMQVICKAPASFLIQEGKTGANGVAEYVAPGKEEGSKQTYFLSGNVQAYVACKSAAGTAKVHEIPFGATGCVFNGSLSCGTLK